MNSESVKYDPTRTLIGAGNVQDAIDALADSSLRIVPKALSTGTDLNDVFEEGIYTYTNTVTNIPPAMRSSTSYAGRLIVLHTSDVHITQIALPNQHVYDIYLRHYSSDGTNYTWSAWYSVSFNEFKQFVSSVPYSYGGSDFIVKCFGKSVNPTNFANSTFDVTAVTRAGHVAKYAVVIDSDVIITRIDGNASSVHPMLGKTGSNNLYVRMIDESASTQPSTTETVDLLIKKIR